MVAKSNGGGIPAIIFYHRIFPQLGKETIKTSTAITMIGGSTVSGEPVPPHLQFTTKYKSEETMRMHMETVAYFHKLLGTFGWNEEKQWLVTTGMNKKGVLYGR